MSLFFSDYYCRSRGAMLPMEEYQLDTCRNCYLFLPQTQFVNATHGRWRPSRTPYTLTDGNEEVTKQRIIEA